MPISIDEFESDPPDSLNLQKGSHPHRLLQFLAAHVDQAFTQSELADETGINPGSVGAALSRLEERGLVRHKGRYWALADDERLASYAAQQGASSASTADDYYGERDT